MFRACSAFALCVLMIQPVFADEMYVAPQRHYHYRYVLPPPRHVIEVVSPPYSARFIINGARFAGLNRACFSWAAGERVTLLAGDWNARCFGAVFYNFTRRSRCETTCGW
jgi:hypothetical protein